MDGKKIVRPYGKALTAVVAVLFFLAFSVWVVSAVECGCGGICVNETGWWRADADYNASGTPIQAAIDNATAGDIICVKDGKYNGNVLVNKEHLTIRSENGSENCSVNATTMPELHVFHVSSDFVNISGFTLQNTTSFAGIYLYYVNHCNISGNNASNNGDGISLFHADSNTVMNNTVSNNSDDGIYLAYSSNNKVMNNTVSYSSDDGIYLKEASNNNLTNNLAFNNTGDGVYLKQTSNNNSLTNNTLTNNTDYDFYSDATSHNNTVEDLRLSSYPTIVSFTYDNGVGLKGVETAPGDPAGKTNINKYVNATNVSIDSWLYLNVSYEDVGCVAEDSLRLWRHNGSAWANVTGTNGVNTVQNYVYATITEFSVFAPMGDGPTLTLGNVTNVTQDWGRNFTLNHSVTAANASAANVNVTYNVTWIPGNTTMGSLTKDETKWHNQSVSNGTVQNVTVRGNATTTSASAANGTGTFWINITKRDINVIAHPPTPQTVDPDETFWINGSAADDYGDALFAKADLIREGSIENTTAIVNGNANFSANESAAGTFNFSIRFYNMTHYTNASSDNATVTVGGPTLTLGNVTNVTQDWGRNFTLNHSVTAANASAANVNVTYNVTWIPGNTTMGSLTKDETKWHNQSRSNGTVQNVTVRVNATTTSASAANATTTFRINITKRDINVIAHPATPQTVDPDETFWINGSAADDYGDALFAKADLIREGSIENTTDIANGNANFSANESAAGTFNFSILFYNLTHYNNASSANATVTVGGAAPNITSFAPLSPVNDAVCTWRTFNITVNQTVNVTWYLNDTAQVPENESVTVANYTFHAEYVGEHNVTAVAENANGTDRQEWVWNVTAAPAAGAPNITDFAPTSPVNDTYCTDRTFNVSVNQTVNVTWYLNDTAQVPKNVSVTAANYTFHALYIGENNVTAVAENANGTDRQEWVWNVTAAPAAGAPNITDFAPTSPVNDTYCTDRTFNVSVNQTVNVTWYLNDTAQVPKNVSVTDANYTFHALYIGDNNVTAVAENANGSDRQEWVWNVTAAPAAGAPNITDFAPTSPVNDTYCTDRTFNVSVNQTVNVTWYLNDTAQVPKNVSVTAANYTFLALYIGDNNVTAVAENANGSDRQEWVWNVTAAPAAGAPNITDFAPTSPVNDTYCTDRTFNVSVNQTVNVTWYLNDTAQVPKNASVTDANYTFHALYIGDNNVTAVAENANGTDRQEWVWNVTAAPAAGAPNITDFAPTSPVNDTYCTDRTFNVSVNQTVNVTWYLNDTAQVPKNASVTDANYTFHALYIGDNNVTAVVENPNGKDMQTWDWNVTEAPEPPIAVPDFSATGLVVGIGMLGIVLAVSVFRRRR